MGHPKTRSDRCKGSPQQRNKVKALNRQKTNQGC
jgi:hypothetical protein